MKKKTNERKLTFWSLVVLSLFCFPLPPLAAGERLDVSYSDTAKDPLKKLDIYMPEKSEKKFPVLIHFHGGGWRTGDKKMNRKHGEFYAANGILFITVNYRLSPAVRHPAHIEDCVEAVNWVFKHLDELNGDPGRVFISGHSAGAHLVSLLATDPVYLKKYGISPSRLAGVIVVDTAGFDLTPGKHPLLFRSLVEKAFGADESVIRSASPLFRIDKATPYPAFLILMSAERPYAVQEAEEFAEKLKKAGGKAEVIPVRNHNHRQMNLGMYDPDSPVCREILKLITPASRTLVR